MNKILLGYEIGNGGEVFIKPSHLIATGLTQLSGKTSTLEALIKRSGLKAVAFKTKRGEAGFSEGSIIPPFFKERSDWQYIQSLLEATLREKMKFERSWIIRVSKGTSNLKEVKANIDKALSDQKLRMLDRSIFTNLQAYFEIILPQLENIEFSKELILRDGINIMDLEELNTEVQSLIIRSVLEHILNHEKKVVVIIPEAWKFLPQERGSPVKQIAEEFIRQGATRENYMWIDSQDMAGVDKTALKQVANWILGLQTERNEVQHTLDQIPLPNTFKPKVEEIMTLKIGHFFVCNPDFTKKVYVQPNWVDSGTARKIAMGSIPVEAVIGKKTIKLKETRMEEFALTQLRQELKENAKKNNVLEKENETLRQDIIKLELQIKKQAPNRNLEKKYNALINKIKKIAENIEEVEGISLPPFEEENRIMPEPLPNQNRNLIVPLEKNKMLDKLGGMAKEIYETLLENTQGLTKAQIGLMTGHPHTSGSFSNTISKLKTMGLVKREGEIFKVV